MTSHSEGERLGKRGRAYECNHCDYVGSASDTIWHITKAHLPLKDVPFHCRLCHYRAKDAKALVKHLETYKPHSKKCLAEKIDPNSEEHLVFLERPYKVRCEEERGVGDAYIMSARESQKLWAERKGQVGKKAKTKKERDMEYAIGILKKQGMKVTKEEEDEREVGKKEVVGMEEVQGEAIRSEVEVVEALDRTKSVCSKDSMFKLQEPTPVTEVISIKPSPVTCQEEDAVVISGDCGGFSSSGNSSSSDSSSSEDETTVAVRNLSKVMNEEATQEKVMGVEKDSKDQESTGVQAGDSACSGSTSIVVELNQDKVVETMAKVVEATLKSSYEKFQRQKTGEDDLYSLFTSIGSQLLNTNCNLAEVTEALQKNAGRAGEGRDEMAKLNKQVWELKTEVTRSNNTLVNLTRVVEAMHNTQKSAAAKMNAMMEKVVTSQKILANSIANQTQALKELRSCSQNETHREERKKEENDRKRGHDRRGVSPLRALSGFDNLYSEEKRRKIHDDNRPWRH